MEGFDFVHRERVRFSDCDPMGHVNNASYSTYVEGARIALLAKDGYSDIILARLELDFRSPAVFGEEIEIGVRVSRVGTKSFELEYQLRAGDRVVAEARSVQVGYDYATRETVVLSDEWRRKLAA